MVTKPFVTLRQPCCFECRQISISSWMTFNKSAEVLWTSQGFFDVYISIHTPNWKTAISLGELVQILKIISIKSAKEVIHEIPTGSKLFHNPSAIGLQWKKRQGHRKDVFCDKHLVISLTWSEIVKLLLTVQILAYRCRRWAGCCYGLALLSTACVFLWGNSESNSFGMCMIYQNTGESDGHSQQKWLILSKHITKICS